MKPEYTVELNGKTVVLYPGLLALAHEQSEGRLQIRTELIQVPGPENGHSAICFAETRISDANGVLIRSCTGLGDADPTNTNKRMALALVRLAETRAKARALRDLTNVAEAVDETDATDDPREPDGGDVPVQFGKSTSTSSENGHAPPAKAPPKVPDLAEAKAKFDSVYAEAERVNLQRLPVLALDAPADYIVQQGTRLWQRLPDTSKVRLQQEWAAAANASVAK